MGDTSIEWTDSTWSPLRARRRDTGKVGQHCERVSPGCTNCYAATWNRRNLPNGGTGLDYTRGSRDLVETFVDERVLTQPRQWRKPRRIFVANQTDLFADFYTDEQRDRVFAVMALPECDKHTFQVLTKRPAAMRDYLSKLPKRMTGRWPLDGEFPLRNVHLGVTAEDQQRADERIPLLLDTPAAVRFVSYEPALGAVALQPFLRGALLPGVDWVIAGGESGPGARECDISWIRSTIAQCRAADVPVFVKQLGARPEQPQNCGDCDPCLHGQPCTLAYPIGMALSDRKGGDPAEWPKDLRVRQWPRAHTQEGNPNP